MNRVDELTLKLLGQTINAEEIEELAELTNVAENQDSFLQLMKLESHLQALGRSSFEDRVLRQIQQERCERVEGSVMRAVTQSEMTVRMNTHTAERETSSRFALTLVGIAAVAASFALIVFINDSGKESESAIAQLNPHGSIVNILEEGGQARSVQATDKHFALRPNESIETSQATDTAEIVYADGTKLELLGETKVRLSATSGGSKQVTILSGVVQADVSPQPKGQPLQIITQAATLEVLGTTLGVEVRDESTQLGVATGRVAMTRKADGQRVEVEAGRFATATHSTIVPLQSHPFPVLRTEWSQDFEGGLPTGWRKGELVERSDGKPGNAVRAKQDKNGRFVITTHNAWQEGEHALCSIDENSVLHLKFRQQAFARITIMIGTRSYPPATGRIGGNLFYTRKAWNEELPAETWKTISIPLKDVAWQMKQGKKVHGPSDLQSTAAYLIHVSTMRQDIGLTIERIWITNVEASQP